MGLPELTDRVYEDFLGEDSFGWSFVVRNEASELSAAKVLKEQAINPAYVEHCAVILADAGISEIAEPFEFLAATPERPPVCIAPFHGWKSKDSGKWQVTSLNRLMHLFRGDQSAEVVRELATAIAQLHRNGIFHGGLKPSGIYLTSDSDGNRRLKIGNFGQLFMGGLQLLQGGEELFYTSPEQLSTGDFSDEAGFRWDVYAFGVTAFRLLTGHLPRLDRLRQQCEERPRILAAAPAISFGELTDLTEHFLGQLEEEKPVEWPNAPRDAREKELRSVVQQCLWFDAGKRAASMGEVSARIEEIFSAKTARKAEEKTARPTVEKPTEKAVGPAAHKAAKGEEKAIPLPPVSAHSKPAPKPAAEADLEVALPDSNPTPEPELATSSEEDLAEEKSIASELSEATGPIKPIGAKSKSPDVTGRTKSNVSSFFTERPQLKWQIASIASTAAAFVLGFMALFLFFEKQRTEQDLVAEIDEVQASVEQQAAAYQKERRADQQNGEQLQAVLNEVEDSNSRLLGEAKLARQLLRQTQENGDEFFRLVLENRDTDVPGFREARAKALSEARVHYERLIEVYGDAPDFIVSTANAFFYLGRIYREMGEFGKSLASFGEAERRYMALLEDADEQNVEFVRNLAVAKQSLGELSTKNGKFAIARHYFTESSRYWGEVRSLDPTKALESAISIQENSLAIVECELAIGRVEAALDGARSIGAGLLALQEKDPENDRIIGALAKSFSVIGQILETQANTENALEAYKQASNLYGKAVKLNAAVDRYHLGLGDSLARTGLLENEQPKLEAAVDVLAEAIVHNPFESAYQRTLADVFGVLAKNQRDGGHADVAIELEQEAISILQPIIRENPTVASPELLFSYSERLAHLAELLGDAGDFDDSRAPLRESITVLERISRSETALPEYRRALARSRGLAGFACLKSGDTSEAKEHLELAKAEWETFVAENPEDSDAEQAVRWTADQLRALR